MFRLMPLLAAACAAGCVAASDISYRSCARRLYVNAHKERPAAILDGVEAGKLTAGMNASEAALCIGRPDRKTPLGTDGSDGEVWIYEKTSKGSSSSLYDITFVSTRVVLTNGPAGPVVSRWTTNE